jgi:hypothetical protein
MLIQEFGSTAPTFPSDSVSGLDLGAETSAVAKAIETYDPDATWQKAEDDRP